MPTALLTTEQAHDGQQAGKVGQEVEFAPLSDNTWADLNQAHHLRLRLWAWLPGSLERSAMLVVSTQQASHVPGAPAKTISYQTMNLCEVVRRYRQWVQSSFFVSLPRTLQGTDKINVYLWVPPGQTVPVYVDDYSIETLD